MSETICPCCGANSPEEGLYCMRCGEPIKCKNCGAGILANARACINCGKLIPERETGEQRFAGGSLVPPGYNRLTVRQRAESYEYDADFLFSNAIGQQPGTGEFISHLAGFSERAPVSRPMPQRLTQSESVVEVDGQRPAVPQLTSGPEPQTSLPNAAGTVTSAPATPELAIRTVFSEHDGKLTLLVQDLKAAHQKDYTQRLVHVFLYARQVIFNEMSVTRQQVYEVTEFAGLPRDNVGAYISQDNQITRDGDMLSLKIGGLQHARKCLLEIVDPTTAGQWSPDGEARPAGKPRKAGKRSDGQTEDQIAAIVDDAETQALARDIPHDVVVDMTVLDKVIVTLYGLYKAGVEGEVLYNTVSEYLYRVFHHEVDGDSIGSALRRATSQNNKYVVHKEGAGYRITPSGITYVEVKYRMKAGPSSAVKQPELTAQQPEASE